MDPITLLTTAIIAGAVAATQETVGQMVKDAYASLKALIASRLPMAKTAVDLIEIDPKSESFKASAQTVLKTAGAEKEVEVLKQAQAVLQAVERTAPHLAAAIGVDLKDVKIGASLQIEDVVARNTGVKLDTVDVKANVVIKKVRAGVSGDDDPNA